MKNQPSPPISGVLLVDKPSGMTSHDVINELRRKTGIKRIGHSGTLDPMATGLLILLFNAYTKKQKEFQDYGKVYSGEILLGVETDTWDLEGRVLSRAEKLELKENDVLNAAGIISGTIIQQVPPYSAVKFKGQTLYKLARKNLPTPVIKKQVSITWLESSYSAGVVKFRIKCSSGTYIRSIAHQLGSILTCGGTLKTLRREEIGHLKISAAVPLEKINKSSPEEVLGMIRIF